MDLVQELFRRRAAFIKVNPRNPFSENHPTIVEVNLTPEEAEELKKIEPVPIE